MVIVTLLSCALFGIFARMRKKPRTVYCLVKVLVLIIKTVSSIQVNLG